MLFFGNIAVKQIGPDTIPYLNNKRQKLPVGIVVIYCYNRNDAD